MGLDFGRFAQASAVDTSTEPRNIFGALPGKNPKYGYPRAGQTEVWERWHLRRDERDLVIKMNTGSGKTVVGLLILKSCLNEAKGPVVYLTPDNYLRDQVCAEARDLGLETTTDPGSARFQQGKAILVVNIYRLVNGQSVFGVTGAARTPIELGTVLVDDAHACLDTVEDQFALTLPSDHPAYEKLFALFKDDLASQSIAGTQDLSDRYGYSAIQIPYWSWTDRQSQVLEALAPHRQEERFRFAWPLIGESVGLCRAAVTTEGIEIKPPVPPIHRIPSFANAQRRIYLTATLADDSVLVTHFAAQPDNITKPVIAKAADDLGDRMILTPLETHPDATEDQVHALLDDLAKSRNVVVIVPSRRRAEAWAAVADRTHDKDTIEAGVAALRAGHVGLVVLINKYDGIDLPDDACRILVLDGLPEAYSPLDRVDAVALAHSEAMLTRQVQRIEQGMGRGVRSSADFCVVVLLGARLTQRLNSGAGRARLSAATRAQIDLSTKVADSLHGKPFAQLRAVIDQCLERDTGWVTLSKSALAGIAYEEIGYVAEDAVAEREAFDLADLGRPQQAFERLEKAFDAVQDLQQRGWLKQQAAGYLHGANAVEAQKIQISAQTDNRAMLKPRAGVTYRRMSGTANQAERASALLAKLYPDESSLVIGVQAILEDLVPDTDAAAVASFEQAVQDLGEHLGFEAERPDRDIGKGPDVLWKLGGLSFLVIECKSGATTDFIAKNDCAQLSSSVDWFLQAYDTSCEVVPVMIHKVAYLHSAATGREGMRVITFPKLAALRTTVTLFAKALASGGAFRDSTKVAEQLHALELNGNKFIEKWGVGTTTSAPK